MQIKVEVLSPEKILFKGAASEVMAPGKLGYMTILPGHARLIAELDVGELRLKSGQEVGERYFVAGGFLEVEDNVVRVLVDIIEKQSDINLDRAKKAADRAEKRLSGRKSTENAEEVDYARAMAALKRAQARAALAILTRTN